MVIIAINTYNNGTYIRPDTDQLGHNKKQLYKRFVAINRRMQEIGIEKYYEEVKDLPRY